MGGYLTALEQWTASAPDNEFWWSAALLAVVVLVGGSIGFAHLRRARMIEDTPTQRIRSAAQGYVELEGKARWIPGPQIHSPLSRQPCVWWRYSIERRQGSGRNARWHRVESGTSDDLFALDDGTGVCVIDPDAARVYADVRRSWRGASERPMRVPQPQQHWFDVIGFSFGRYRYREQLISLNAPLHAMGRFDTARAIREDDNEQDVRELLVAWKQDRAALMARFDENDDGEIDMQEWARAREAAREQVRRERVQEPPPQDVHVLRRPADRRPFVLSTWPQAKLARHKRMIAFPLLVLSAAASVLLILALLLRLGA
ncbi:GIDE domain-containing protein [Algiphilus sp.]|uniref:GIDE domain-containing protein n=1 Tax=Algiphilus sp. TaxID=1872431 RepID=UPI002A66B96E|nr:E3 ubiquitin ligase family protein [Pseudomonadota bacterium]